MIYATEDSNKSSKYFCQSYDNDDDYSGARKEDE